jgi:hypothetical protein
MRAHARGDAHLWAPRQSLAPRRLPARRAGPAGAGILVVAATGIVLLAAACSGGTSSAGGTFPGGTYTQSLAYTKCMRSHGVPQFPAPDSQGNFSNAQIQQLDQNDPQERNAFFTCRSLLPNEGTGLTVTQLQDIQQQNLENAVKAAHCMRAHGIQNFPDPAGSTQGSGIDWQPVVSAGLNLDTPSYQAAFDACSGKRVGGPIPPMFAPGAVPPSPAPSGAPRGRQRTGVRMRPAEQRPDTRTGHLRPEPYAAGAPVRGVGEPTTRSTSGPAGRPQEG